MPRVGPLPPPHARLFPLALLVTLVIGCGHHNRALREPPEVDPATIPEAFARSTAALAWPFATRAFQVTPAGDLYNGAWRVRFEPVWKGSSGDTPALTPDRIAFEERWRPVAHWERTSGPLRWRFEAFAWPARGDTNLFVSLRVRVHNPGSSPHRAGLTVTLSPPDSTCAFLAPDAPERATEAMAWTSASDGRRAGAWCAVAKEGPSLTLDWDIPAASMREERFVLSAYPRPARELARFAAVAHPERAAEARAFWDREVTRGARFELGDPEVEHAIDAARVLLLACRERRDGVALPIGAPLQYRDVWLRDGARAIRALSMLGYTAEARELARGIATLQWDSGAFLTQAGQPDGTGQALWAIEQAALRPTKDSAVADLAERAARAWRWSERQRATMAELDSRHRALMPYADPRDNELGRAQFTGTDAWSIAGYRAAGRLARAAGRTALADSIERTERDYSATFLRALALGGHADIPAAWDRPARDWGNVAALYPCRPGEAADPAQWSRHARTLARRLLAAANDGMLTYGIADSLHGYLGADFAAWLMLDGDRVAADRMLDALLRWRSASGGGAELFSLTTRDFGRNLPPHATSAATLVALVRESLVHDDGPSLCLTFGARSSWWKRSRLHAVPTRWGTLDVTFARDGDVAEWEWSAVPVTTRLRLPPGTVLEAADAPVTGTPGGDEVVAPPGITRARVRVRSSGAHASEARTAR